MISGTERKRGGESLQDVRGEGARPLQRVQPQSRPQPQPTGKN
jgi:hypothetical protein